MKITKISLNSRQTLSPLQEYRNGIIKGFSKKIKQIDAKYLYNQQGWQRWSKVLRTKQYYVMKAQEEILMNQSGEILNLMKQKQFILIDIGAGNGQKTMTFIQESFKKSKQMEYVGIDISQKGNQMLIENLKKLNNDKVNATIITSLFEDGLRWVGENKKRPFFYFFIGITIGNFIPQERRKFLKLVHNNMKKGDLFLITFDQKKDPLLIQKAYFNETKLFDDTLIINAKRLNEISKYPINLQNFWTHSFYDPFTGIQSGLLVSKIDQTININDKQFTLSENQPISILRSQRFSLRDFKGIMNEIGFQYVKHFQDSNKYGMAVVFQKKA